MTFIYVRGDPGASGCGQPGTGRRASHRLQPRPAIKRAGILPPLGHCPALTAQSARMLTHLAIRDFAVVTAAELEFGTGLTVISGETGAGKSLLVDALGFLSGQRADSGMVRHGAGRAELHAEFDLATSDAARPWLREEEFATTERRGGKECVSSCRLRWSP